MRKLALVIVALGLWPAISFSQDVTSEGTEAESELSAEEKETASKEFAEKYRILVSRLGVDGVGVETVLNNWEKVDPENIELLIGKYAYYMSKAQTIEVVTRPEKKYLGRDAVLSLKDSLGNDVYYFQQSTFDDSLFTVALKWLDKIIGLYPKDLRYRGARTDALILYEGESPDMALLDALNLIDIYYSDPSGWEYDGEEVDDELFMAHIQEVCYSFYSLGTHLGRGAFKSLSDRMLEIDANNTDFLSNVGTYYLVDREDPKTALKYYNKVLKIKPNDYTAAKNCVLIYRDQKNAKMEKKYLPALIASTTDEAERMSSEMRLKSL